MAQRLILLAATLAAGFAAPGAGRAAHAQSLADPTRPPALDAPAAAIPVPAPAAPRLQTVLLSRERRLAVIDGETVPLGGRFGRSTVVRITESEVVLRNGAETQVLKLHPSAQKRRIR